VLRDRSGGVLYVGVTNVPLFRNRPVEDLCAGRDFLRPKGQQFTNLREATPQSIPGYTATERKEFANHLEQVAPGPLASTRLRKFDNLVTRTSMAIPLRASAACER